MDIYGGGSVELIDYSGTDLTVVNSARVSMNKHSDELTKKDKNLIMFLANSSPPHFTPFTHCSITFRIKMPIFVARQWFKSQVGFSRNEVSRRYVTDRPTFYSPKELRKASENIKQGSLDEPVENSERLLSLMENSYNLSEATYHMLIVNRVCAEQARMVLPQAMFTEFYETGSLYAYYRLYNLRREATHAQRETQEYAEAIGSFLEELYPVSWVSLVNRKEIE